MLTRAFVLQRDHFSLGEIVPLPQAQAQTLVEVLNRQFESDGLQFYLGNANHQGVSRCYLRLDADPEIRTTLPETAMRRDVRPYLPQGKGAGKWNSLLNEMQMLLHDHPLNVAREQAGELPINSLWLSGGGCLPVQVNSDAGLLMGNHPFVRGLGEVTQLTGTTLPLNAEELLKNQQIDAETVTLVLDDAHDAESNWFKPLLTALRSGKIQKLTLNFSLLDRVASFTAPLDLWKFWRKPRQLRDFFV